MSNVRLQVAKFSKGFYFLIYNLVGALKQLALKYKVDRALFTVIAATIVFYSNYHSTTTSLESAPYIFRNIDDYGIKCQRIASQKVTVRKPLAHYLEKTIRVKNSVCYIVYKRNDIEYTYSKLASKLRGF